MAKNEQNELMTRFRPRCVECGDCLVWQGSLSHGKTPVARDREKRVRSIRAMLLEAVGKEISAKYRPSVSCGTEKCIEPSHLIRISASKLGKRSAEQTGYHLDPVRNKRIFESRLHRNKITPELALKIRHAEGAYKDIAEREGVPSDAVAKIKRGERFKEYGNPFAGLFAANDSSRKRVA